MKVTISEMKKQLNGRKYLQIKKLQEAFIQSMKRTHTTLNGSGKKKKIKTMGRGPEQTFCQRRHTKANRQRKNCSTTLPIRKTQIKP